MQIGTNDGDLIGSQTTRDQSLHPFVHDIHLAFIGLRVPVRTFKFPQSTAVRVYK